MTDVLVLAVLFSATFALSLMGHGRIALLGCLAVLPYNGFLFQGAHIVPMAFGANQSMVAGLLLGSGLNRTLSAPKAVARPINVPHAGPLALLAIMAVVSYLSGLADPPPADVTAGEAWLSGTLYKFIIGHLLSFGLMVVVFRAANSLADMMSLITAFLCSAALMYVGWLGFAFQIPLPDFLAPVYSLNADTDMLVLDRYGSRWADYELFGELTIVFAVLATAVLIGPSSRKQKWIAALVLVATLPVGASTGTRALLAMPALFAGVAVVLNLFRRDASLRSKMAASAAMPVAALLAMALVLVNPTVRDRAMETASLAASFLQGGVPVDALQAVANRDYTNTYRDILSVGGWLGIGPLQVRGVAGSAMVYHCLYYHVVVAFGIVGLGAWMSFWTSVIRLGLRGVRGTGTGVQGVLLTALLVTLLVDQVKINYWREPSHILVYGFVYALVSVVGRLALAARPMEDSGEAIAVHPVPAGAR